MGRLAFRLLNLHLYPFTRAKNLALEIETATFLRVVQIKQLLEPFHHLFDICFSCLWGFDVEDPACFVQVQTGRLEGCRGSATFGGGMFRCSRGLLVRLCEGSTEDSGTGKNDLAEDAMGL